MGIMVLMDIVHSHASKNANDGIDGWDGTGEPISVSRWVSCVGT